MDERSRKDLGSGGAGQASHLATSRDEDIWRALADRGSFQDTELLRAVRVRIHRSIADPKSSLSLDQIDDFIDGMVAKAKLDGVRA